ncbi:MAG: alcohol dehydrogenase catalytic domain-containing protein [Ruminococcus sp.]|nr:alcohol dehydrogenase catalytic domain-containing protein [Ruminococcus sp.]
MEIPKKMKAVMLVDYNKTEVREVPVPAFGTDEVLCRIRAVAICGSDPKVIEGHYSNVDWPPYFPFIMGHEWSGEVVATGKSVTEFKVGDRVAGEAHNGCGHCRNCMSGNYTVCLNYGMDGLKKAVPDKGHRHYGFYFQGANAEYGAFKVGSLHKIPDGVSFDAAALTDTAGVALRGVEKAGVTPGGTTVIIGPGPIGLCAMQECIALGAGQTVVVGRGYKLEMAKRLGASVCIDIEKEDPVQSVLELTNSIGADEVIECSGANDSPVKAVHMLKKTGVISLIANYREDKEQIPLPLNKIVFNDIKIYGSKANPNVSDTVLHMIASGAIRAEEMITHRFPLEQYDEAVDIFKNKRENSVKVVIHP